MPRSDRSRRSFSKFSFLILTKYKLAASVLALTLASLSCLAQDQSQIGQESNPQSNQTQSAVQNATVTVPAGTRIALVLTHPIQSRYIHRGDDVYAQITSPITSGHDVVIPPGTFVQGKVDKLDRKGGRGELHLQSMAITFPDGYVAPVSGPITLESDDGYALKDPGKGRIIAMFALPGAGVGLGALIGHAASSAQPTTLNTSLPPTCGVPTPGCSGGQSLTVPPDRLKSTAIGSVIGLAIGGVAAIALLTNSHNFYLDMGSPAEMVLQQPLSLQQGRVADAVTPAKTQPPIQAIAPRPPQSPPTTGMCYTPGTPGTPPTIIPGTPPMGNSPGTPEIVIPGTPGTPGMPIPCS
jgi:hypothetical protein